MNRMLMTVLAGLLTIASVGEAKAQYGSYPGGGYGHQPYGTHHHRLHPGHSYGHGIGGHHSGYGGPHRHGHHNHGYGGQGYGGYGHGGNGVHLNTPNFGLRIGR